MRETNPPFRESQEKTWDAPAGARRLGPAGDSERRSSDDIRQDSDRDRLDVRHAGEGADVAGRLTVAKMNVDENPEVPMRFGIRGIPTLMLFKGGSMVDTIVGAVDKDTIRKMVERHV